MRATLSSRVKVSTCDEDAALGADVALDAVCRSSDVIINADVALDAVCRSSDVVINAEVALDAVCRSSDVVINADVAHAVGDVLVLNTVLDAYVALAVGVASTMLLYHHGVLCYHLPQMIRDGLRIRERFADSQTLAVWDGLVRRTAVLQ